MRRIDMTLLFPGAYPNQQIILTFQKEDFCDPGYVLIFAFAQEKLLFTHHRERGWELPGGTREPDEWPIMTAMREVYEETGAELSAIEPIGQYIINYPDQPRQIKTIYIAKIQQLHPLPSGFETDNRKLIEPPDADNILINPQFSLLLKDGVYRHSLPVALAAQLK